MRTFVCAVLAAVLASSSWPAEQSEAFKAPVPPDEMPQHLVKVLRTTNKAQTNRYVPKVYEMKNVNPFDVQRFFRRVMEIEEGQFATFVKPNGKSGLVVVVAPEYQIPYLDELMAHIDRPGLTSSSGDDPRYIRLQHRAADDLGFLATLFSEANHSPTRPTRGTRAGDTDLIADLETGSIFIYAPPSISERIEALIKELDKPMPQVLVSATVYEIDLNNDGAVGFDYFAWMNGPGRNLFAQGLFAEYGSVDRLKGGVNVYDPGLGNTFGLPHHRFRNHGYNTAYFLDVSTAYFDFLITKGVARVVTSGRLMSKIPSNYIGGLNAFGQIDFRADRHREELGSPAEFEAHDEVLYYRVQTVPTVRGSARPAGLMLDPYGESEEFEDNRTLLARLTPLAAGGTEVGDREIASIDVGTRLRVLPRIATENILLDLQLEVSSLLGFDGIGEPRISARRAVANVHVTDNEEVVFGGLERASRIQSARKFPFFGKIPVLGWILGGENSGVKKSVVVAVVKASRMQSGLTETAQTLKDQVAGNEETPMPASRFGFDQWLLDK